MDKSEEAYPMSSKKYHVSLTEAEREALLRLSKSQRHSERERKRARILLLADETQEGGAAKDTAIAERIRVAPLTVNRIRQRFAERGLQESLHHKEQETRKARVLDGQAEAHLIALTCSAPPEGQKRWSLRLLRSALIEQQIVDAIGQETVRQTLKKMNSSRG
jgi:hypothetical protein